ncbi:hypothetical protein BR93DRAFT_935317 [Coniochaeta sp. PMI_546]|nr:hypothetical protein BR93DRAFT_935317 [Coniochaeta sp. PMI_546]
MTNVSAAMPDILQPTYTGFVRTSRDVCLLLEMSLSGRLPHVPRRPHERERAEIVKSGNIFIYEETASGVRRWTDGVNWSPSRILGNFLIYRETEQGFPGDGAKKTALKRNRGSISGKPSGIRKNRSPPSAMPAALYSSYPAVSQPGNYGMAENELCNMEERDLYGSLIDSYPFKAGGLVKKTITVTVDGVPHHLVSYYKAEDVLSGKLKTPSMDPQFIGIQPRESLLRNSTFRVPVEQEEFRINENSEAYITQDQAHVHGLYQPQPAYQPRAMSMHSHSLPDHGLATGGMTGMQAYGSSPFSFPAQPQMPAHAATTLAGGIQGLPQHGMEAISSGHYPQPTSQAFADGQEAYIPNGFNAGPSRHLSYPPAQSNVYAPPSAQGNVYGPPSAAGYATPRDYRQPSVAGPQNGYVPVVPAVTPPNPSPTGRDTRGVGALEGDHGAMGWHVDFQNNAQDDLSGFNACDLPLRTGGDNNNSNSNSNSSNTHSNNNGIVLHVNVWPQYLTSEDNNSNVQGDADGTSTIETAGPKTPTISPVAQIASLVPSQSSRGSSAQGDVEWMSKILPSLSADLAALPEPAVFSSDAQNGEGVGGFVDSLGGPAFDNMDRGLAHNGDEFVLFGNEWRWGPLLTGA